MIYPRCFTINACLKIAKNHCSVFMFVSIYIYTLMLLTYNRNNIVQSMFWFVLVVDDKISSLFIIKIFICAVPWTEIHRNNWILFCFYVIPKLLTWSRVCTIPWKLYGNLYSPIIRITTYDRLRLIN